MRRKALVHISHKSWTALKNHGFGSLRGQRSRWSPPLWKPSALQTSRENTGNSKNTAVADCITVHHVTTARVSSSQPALNPKVIKSPKTSCQAVQAQTRNKSRQRSDHVRSQEWSYFQVTRLCSCFLSLSSEANFSGHSGHYSSEVKVSFFIASKTWSQLHRSVWTPWSESVHTLEQFGTGTGSISWRSWRSSWNKAS